MSTDKVDLSNDPTQDFYLELVGDYLEFELEAEWYGCCSGGLASRSIVLSFEKAKEMYNLLQKYLDEQ